MSLLNPYSPAPPAAWRLRAAICGSLMLTLAGGCPPWSGLPLHHDTACEGPSGRCTGPCNENDIIPVEPDDVLKLKLAGGEARGLEGSYPVLPDGSIDLGQYGKVYVAGGSLTGAMRAVEHHLARTLDHPEVRLEIADRDDRYFDVILQGWGEHDRIVRKPLGKIDTVLDGLSKVDGLPELSGADIWIERPQGRGGVQTLRVDWDALVRDADTSTIYQLVPGDRIFVSRQQPVIR